jgi:hypothetical protein
MALLNGEAGVPGRQLLPVVVDERNSKSLFARVPKSQTHLQDGLIDVTCGDFARAVNRAAGWLEDNFGRSSSFDTLAYIGPSDIRYFMFLLGASKVGYKVETLEQLIMNSLTYDGICNRLSYHPHATASRASWRCSKQRVVRQSSLPKDIVSSLACWKRVLFHVIRFRKLLNFLLKAKFESINLIKALMMQRATLS